eukprot:609755_1
MACTKWGKIIKRKCCNRSIAVVFMFVLSLTTLLAVFTAFVFTDTDNWTHIVGSIGMTEDLDKKLNHNAFTIKNRENVIFFHIPKTGGKLIEQLFINEFNISSPNTLLSQQTLLKKSYRVCGAPHHMPINWLFEKISNDINTNSNVSSHSNIRNKMFHISPYYYSKFPYLRTDSFAVVRNPYSRFTSQYQYCTALNYGCTRDVIKFFSTHCRQYLSSKSDDALCKKLNYLRHNASFAYEHGDTVEKMSKSKNSIWKQFDFCDVKIFNKFAYVVLKYLLEEAYTSNDKHKRAIFHCHYVKQSEYIYNYTQHSDKMINYILKTERLTDDLIRLGKTYNISIDERMITKYRNQWEWSKNCKNIKPNVLNMENKQLFNKLYHDDFINFNYSMTD